MKCSFRLDEGVKRPSQLIRLRQHLIVSSSSPSFRMPNAAQEVNIKGKSIMETDYYYQCSKCGFDTPGMLRDVSYVERYSLIRYNERVVYCDSCGAEIIRLSQHRSHCNHEDKPNS